jgi:acetolactate synthase-1/2/3 large subunit
MEVVHRAATMLSEAKKPVIVGGGGAVRSGAWGEITDLAERMQIPVGTSLSGKGLIADDHPLSIGPVGSYSRRVANDIVSDADLVMYVGAHAGGQLTNNKSVPPSGTPVIHIDINPAQIGKNVPVTLGLVGDARTVTAQINSVVKQGQYHSEWAAETARRVREWWDEQSPYYNSNDKPVEPHRLARDLSASIPPDTLVVADTGYAASWAAAYVTLRTGCNFLRCEGSLGWAFPAAIGAKAAEPQRPVVCWTGDGGFWYHLGELETAIRCEIPTVTVVLNNHGLKFDTHLLEFVYGERGKQTLELSEFTDVNFADVATAMGGLGLRVEDPDDIAATIKLAIDSGRPAIVDVVTSNAVAPVRVFQEYASG